LLGIPADQLLDQTPPVEELWRAGEVRLLAEQVAADPAGTLTALVVDRAVSREVDGFGARVLAMAKAGLAVAVMAEGLGISSSQLHRRCPVRIRLRAAAVNVGLPAERIPLSSPRGCPTGFHCCECRRCSGKYRTAGLVDSRNSWRKTRKEEGCR
jgi:hypothetical protein